MTLWSFFDPTVDFICWPGGHFWPQGHFFWPDGHFSFYELVVICDLMVIFFYFIFSFIFDLLISFLNLPFLISRPSFFILFFDLMVIFICWPGAHFLTSWSFLIWWYFFLFSLHFSSWTLWPVCYFFHENKYFIFVTPYLERKNNIIDVMTAALQSLCRT